MNETPTPASELMNKQDAMIKKAFTMYMEKEARKLQLKAPHKDKAKKQRRAANKVARKSRAQNR